jgi:zinc transport system ATP-binding protein
MPTAPPLLAAHEIRFSYRRTAVLTGVSFAVHPGEFVALAGPNGAGKTTLLRVLLGLTTAEGGSARLFGEPPRELRDRWRVGYVPQRPTIVEGLPATVEEVVASGLLARRGWWRRPRRDDRAEIDRALEAVALDDLRHQLLTELSGGQQQWVFIAKALVCRPPLLVLDEPIAGVDVASQALFRDTLVRLRGEGAGVLLVSHELGAVADDLDRVLVLRRGRIEFDGTPAELTATGVSLGIHHDDLPAWLESVE